jgi:hypothetical protein
MSAHTPGPWYAVKPTEDVTAKQDGWFIVDRADEMGHNVLYGWPDDVLEANALLAAAAPELLQACRDALFACANTKLRHVLETAIAKAEGR